MSVKITTVNTTRIKFNTEKKIMSIVRKCDKCGRVVTGPFYRAVVESVEFPHKTERFDICQNCFDSSSIEELIKPLSLPISRLIVERSLTPDRLVGEDHSCYDLPTPYDDSPKMVECTDLHQIGEVEYFLKDVKEKGKRYGILDIERTVIDGTSD